MRGYASVVLRKEHCSMTASLSGSFFKAPVAACDRRLYCCGLEICRNMGTAHGARRTAHGARRTAHTGVSFSQRL